MLVTILCTSCAKLPLDPVSSISSDLLSIACPEPLQATIMRLAGKQASVLLTLVVQTDLLTSHKRMCRHLDKDCNCHVVAPCNAA